LQNYFDFEPGRRGALRLPPPPKNRTCKFPNIAAQAFSKDDLVERPGSVWIFGVGPNQLIEFMR
jgi:hypothetical protein